MTPRAQDLAQRLQERLQPQALEVLDESAAHAGHVGANDSGQGTHSGSGLAARLSMGCHGWPATGLCMMRCKISLIRVFMPWRLRLFRCPDPSVRRLPD